MSRNGERLPWHKLNKGKQNWIIIGICGFISLFVIGIFSLISK